MVSIRAADAKAKLRLKNRTKGFQDREPYRKAIQELGGGQVIEVVPDQGETLRKIKLNLTRAAKDIGKSVTYGETADNTVLAWLSDADGVKKPRRARRKSGEADGEE